MISCVITTYNRPINILNRAINSVLRQTYRDIELIIVNDYPEDKKMDTKIYELIKSYNDPRITYIVHEENKGACAARNTGINVSKGQFIAFLDDDDEWLDIKLEEQLLMMENDEIGLVYCDNYRVDKNEKKTLHKNRPDIFEKTIFETLLVSNFIGSTSFPLLRKSNLVQAGKFDESIESAQDLDLWLRMAKVSKFVYCEKPLVKYYVSEVSISTDISSRIQGFMYILEKYKNDYINNIYIYNKRLLYIASAFFFTHHFTESFRFYIKAFKVKPFSLYNIVVPLKSLFLEFRKMILRY
ncbi:MAG: glycosyltransferase family 2 protein [bacterium]